MLKDLIEIFNDEYNKKNLLTAHNTAEKLTAKGYRKASDVAKEIFYEIDKLLRSAKIPCINAEGFVIPTPAAYWAIYHNDYDELKKKYTEGE